MTRNLTCGFLITLALCACDKEAPPAPPSAEATVHVTETSPPAATTNPEDFAIGLEEPATPDAELVVPEETATPGEKLDRALESTGRALQVAGEKTEEGAAVAAEKTEKGLRKAIEATGEGIRRAGEAIERKAGQAGGNPE